MSPNRPPDWGPAWPYPIIARRMAAGSVGQVAVTLARGHLRLEAVRGRGIKRQNFGHLAAHVGRSNAELGKNLPSQSS